MYAQTHVLFHLKPKCTKQAGALPTNRIFLFIPVFMKTEKKMSLTPLLCNQDVGTLEGGPRDDRKPRHAIRLCSADGDESLRAGRRRQEPTPHSSQSLIKKLKRKNEGLVR